MSAKTPPPRSSFMREILSLGLILSSPIRPVRLSKNAEPLGRGIKTNPVLVLPGILSSDYATSLMRRTLIALGYQTYALRMGVITGVTPRLFAKAENRIDVVWRREGRKVCIIRISLGGILLACWRSAIPKRLNLL